MNETVKKTNDKIRLNLYLTPSIFEQIENLKVQSGYTKSTIVSIMLKRALEDEELLQKIFHDYDNHR